MCFVDWYESTGELLGEGAFGHVTTYRHNRTNKEFAVKVSVRQNLKVFMVHYINHPWMYNCLTLLLYV